MARQRPRAGPQMALPHFRPFSPTPHKSVRPCLRPSALSNAREIHLTMSLIGLQREFLLRTLRELQAPGLLYILVLDDTTEALLNRVLPKEKLLRVVTSVDKIDNKRRTQTFLEAIYFVELTPYNLNCIVADVQVHRYKAGPPTPTPSTSTTRPGFSRTRRSTTTLAAATASTRCRRRSTRWNRGFFWPTRRRPTPWPSTTTTTAPSLCSRRSG